MHRGRYNTLLLLLLLLVAVVIFPFNKVYADSGKDLRKIILPKELNADLLDNLFVQANKNIANDAPGSHFFGISITVWPFGDYIKKTPSFDIRFRFRNGGSVSSYTWKSEKNKLDFKKDTHIAIGPEYCDCGTALWADVKRLNSLILFGYNLASGKFTPHESSAYELNTNTMAYNCKWRLWFFHEGNNVGSFVLEKSGPKLDN